MESRADFDQLLASPEGLAAVGDVPNYATGGATFLYTEMEEIIKSSERQRRSPGRGIDFPPGRNSRIIGITCRSKSSRPQVHCRTERHAAQNCIQSCRRAPVPRVIKRARAENPVGPPGDPDLERIWFQQKCIQ